MGLLASSMGAKYFVLVLIHKKSFGLCFEDFFMGVTMHHHPTMSHEESMQQTARDFHDHNLTELSTINRVLNDALSALEEEEIPYALIGGLAAKNLGRPRVTHDIDLFVKPDDARRVLDCLEKRGFVTQERDPVWLFKAWKEEILVDVIFRSTGDIYFSEEVREHVRRIPYNNRFINAISPEDLIVIKAAVHDEHGPHHWHDALAVLTQGNLDWEYLLIRSKHASRRVLALLMYAQSKDLAVPNEVIQRLYRSIYEAPHYQPASVIHPYKDQSYACSEFLTEKEPPIYIKGRIMEALTSDHRVAEHDIKIMVSENTIVAKGEVFTPEQLSALHEVVGEIAPQHEFKCLVMVRVLGGPEGSEAIK